MDKQNNEEQENEIIKRVKKLVERANELAKEAETEEEQLKILKKHIKEIAVEDIEKYNMEIVLQGLKEGLPNGEIISKSEGTIRRNGQINVYRNRLIRKGSISSKEIEEAIINRRKQIKRKQRELTEEEIERKEIKKAIEEETKEKRSIEEKEKQRKTELCKQAVLEGLREGLTYKQIVKKNSDIIKSTSAVYNYKKLLIDEGRLKINEADISKEIRLKKEQENKLIIELYNMGFKREQILKVLKMNATILKERMKTLRSEGRIQKNNGQHTDNARTQMCRNRREQIEKLISNPYTKKRRLLDVTRRHIEYCRATIILDMTDIEDIDIISEAITTFDELIDAKSIQVVARGYLKAGEPDMATYFLKQCEKRVKYDAELQKIISEARKEIEKYIINKKTKSIKDIAKSGNER